MSPSLFPSGMFGGFALENQSQDCAHFSVTQQLKSGLGHAIVEVSLSHILGHRHQAGHL
jgi:hypothetical protein